MRDVAGRLVVAVVALAASAGCLESGVVECSDGRICVAGFVCGIDSCIREDFCVGLELGSTCSAPGIPVGGCVAGVCMPTRCGDGRTDASEACDDENHLSHDGCSSVCTAETPVWTKLAPAPSPGAVTDAAMTYDERRGRVVLFGGTAMLVGPLAKTWEWDGAAWEDVTPTTASPPPRTSAMMAYDAARGETIMFGGTNGTTAFLGDTWAWNGTAWSPRASAAPLVARHSAAVAYDAARERIVVFGGFAAAGRLAETLTWDGTTWANVTPSSGSPPARLDSAMAYDIKRARVVLYGGAGDALYADTWEWDGASWTEIVPQAAAPFARSAHAMTYDPHRSRVVVDGGYQTAETWEWDGTSWSSPVSANLPPARAEHVIAYDAPRARILTFGGSGNGFSYSGDTWTLQYRDDTPSEDCRIGGDGDGDGLAACADPDCWAYCTPHCPPETSCPAPVVGCGDSQCNPSLDLCSLCPQDCTATCS